MAIFSSKSGCVGIFSNTRYIRSELEKRRDLLYQIAYSWCHDTALADDLVQETMLKALKNAKQLKNPDAVRGWLSKILANCWYDYLRRRKETVDLDNLPYEEFVHERDTNDRQDIVDRVRQSIGKLPVAQRQVITLVDLAGFSYAEIAEILDIPIGTVMSRLHRARKNLLARLETATPEAAVAKGHMRVVK